MASGHKINLNNDPDRSNFCKIGRKSIVNDSSSLLVENSKVSLSSNKDSQPLAHQCHGKEPVVSQDSQSSSYDPLGHAMNLNSDHVPQTGGISNIPGSSRQFYHHSSENVSKMVQETETFSGSQHGIRFGRNEDAGSYISSEKKFSASQNRESFQQDLCVQQTSKNDGSHPLTIQSSDEVRRSNEQLVLKRHNFTENIMNAMQELHKKNKMRIIENSVSPSFYPSAKQFDFKRFDSLTQQHSGNQTFASQNSHPLSHQIISNFGQTAFSLIRKVCRNQSSCNIPSYVPNSGESSRMQDTPLQSFQHSDSRLGVIQSQHQPENRFHPKSGINLTQDCGLNSHILNKTVVNLDMYSLSRLPVESETQKLQRLNLLPQTLIENIPNECQSPRSYFQQQLKRTSIVPHAAYKPRASVPFCPLPSNFPGRGRFMNIRSIIYDKVLGEKIYIETFNLRGLQHPYSNRSEPFNILLYGSAEWTTLLVRTSAGGILPRSTSPYSFAFHRNITRCGILMLVSVWQIVSLLESINFIKSCLSSKSTIMLVLDAKYKSQLFLNLESLIGTIRRDISRNVPIIVVGSKFSTGTSFNVTDNVEKNSLAFINMRFRMKAKYDLSAFLECSVDSAEEVEGLMFTALDVSRISNKVTPKQ